MCGRFTLRTPLNVLMKQFAFESICNWRIRYNVAPTQDVLKFQLVELRRKLFGITKS